jgi:hypothetical protein
VLYAADGFGGLQMDSFGTPDEHGKVDTATAYICLYGSVLLLTFLLVNFAIAIVYQSYSVLREVFHKAAAADLTNLGNAQVRLIQLFALPGF